MKMTKNKCYDCKWRGEIRGDCHSCCEHPSLKEINQNLDAKLMSIFAGVQRVAPVNISSKEMNIRASQYGINNGWFNFPFNFDPTWLKNCDGFEMKGE